MKFDAPRREDIVSLRLLWKEAFGDPDSFLDAFFASAFSEKRARCAYLDGKVAGALYWFDCQYDDLRVAYIYAVATAEAYRGRGVCRALMEDTHTHLRARGYAGAVLVPGDGGLFEMYRKMGYQTCGYLQKFACDARVGAVSVTEIDRSEFAILRRRYLPLHGIVQERENLSFLEAEAAFYKGEDFLLACRKVGDTLQGIELLGSIESAPLIVHAMGCRFGEFRTVGDCDDVPFAMCHLFENRQIPTYLGFAFD